MRSEANTPIEERYLWLEGRVSSGSMELIKSGLPSARPPNTEVVFVGFAYADIPFTKQFDIVFARNKPQDGVRCGCRVIAATQEIGKPFLEVPHGWKTVCVIEFPRGVPELVQQLPVVDAWYQNKEWVCICDEEAWEVLKIAQADRQDFEDFLAAVPHGSVSETDRLPGSSEQGTNGH